MCFALCSYKPWHVNVLFWDRMSCSSRLALNLLCSQERPEIPDPPVSTWDYSYAPGAWFDMDYRKNYPSDRKIILVITGYDCPLCHFDLYWIYFWNYRLERPLESGLLLELHMRFLYLYHPPFGKSFCFLRQGLTMYPLLVWSSICRSGWPGALEVYLLLPPKCWD